MNMTQIPKWLIILGLMFIVAGFIFWIVAKIGIPMGKLPGDIQVQSEKFSFYFPIVTSIVLLIVLTIVINLILWIYRK